MKIDHYEFEAKWTTDCGGKQDFDFPVVEVSVRYWPDFNAQPTILIGEEKLVHHEGYINGGSELETKRLVEEWVREQISIIIQKLTNSETPLNKVNKSRKVYAHLERSKQGNYMLQKSEGVTDIGKFTFYIDALNYASTLGWNLVQTNILEDGRSIHIVVKEL
ncbi:hypothetical protein ACQKJG_18445 [Priestia megaterium]|uniref:hypothetical protein n=1 Tax=Priestia megaterium TaxID=1404 RepID=UPI003D0844D7